MKKFKIGDRVRLVKPSSNGHLAIGAVGTVKYVDDGYNEVCVEWDNFHHGHGGEIDNLKIPDKKGWYVNNDILQFVASYPVITIQTDGKTTTAILREGHNIINTAKAVCCEEDEFDYLVGAQIALERVMKKEEKREEKKFELGMRVKDDWYNFEWGYVTYIDEDESVFITPPDMIGDFLRNGAIIHKNCYCISDEAIILA